MSLNNTLAHVELARSGVDTIMPKFQSRRKKLYPKFGWKTVPETQLYHRQLSEGDFPRAAPVNEQAEIVPVNFWTGESKDRYWIKYGLGWRTSDEALTTDQYGITKRASEKMAQAMENTKEATAAALFNNHTATSAPYVLADGVALVSTAHPINGDTWSNRGVTSSSTDVDLSVVTLEQMIQNAMYNPLSREGEPAEVFGPWDLWVHPANLGLAERLVTTMQGRPQSADNDKNWSAGHIRKVYANPRFTDEDAFWLVAADAMDNPLRMITHGGAKTKVKEYVETDEWGFFRTEKWLFCAFDARGIHGTVGG